MRMQNITRVICSFGVVVMTMFGASAAQQAPVPAAPGGQARGGTPGGRGVAAAPPPANAPLFFREGWKQQANGQQHPVTPDVVSDPNLELKLYGASAKEILV